MTGSPGVERKVRQLDNDVASIYELLDDINIKVGRIAGGQLRQASRLDQIEDHLSRIDGVLADHSTKLDRLLEILEPGDT